MTKKERKKENAYIAKRMTEVTDQWKMATGMSQEDLAELIGVKSPNSITDWRRGYSRPSEDNLKKVCDVTGVPIDVFYPSTHGEKYEYDVDAITEIGKENAAYAEEKGLNLELVRAISNMIDFDSLFPLYSPIVYRGEDPETHFKIYGRRADFPNSGRIIDDELKFIQIERDGKLITFHRCDLAFLKEVQDQVIGFVKFLFYNRREEMEQEVRAFNDDLIIEAALPDGSVKPAQKDPTKDFILAHDRFAQYFDTIKDESVRKATQEDWDRFWGGDTKLDDGGAATTKGGE